MACLLLAPPAAAQGILEQFSYEGLRVTALGADVGATVSDRLNTDVSASIRLDAGFIAPRLRPLLSVSYLRSRYTDAEITKLETRLAGVVIDPTNDFTIDIGTIALTNVSLDLDLQYLVGGLGRVVPYAGVGLGVHLRNADGAAIRGTLVEDALESIVAALNGSAGLEVAVVPDLRLTGEVRGVLASGLKAVSFRGGFMYRLPRRIAP
jgi:hypothetical protein